jgi:hypothetical protein
VDKSLLARVFGSMDGNVQNDGFLFEFTWEDEWRLGYLGDALRPYKERFDAKTHESRSDEEKYRPIETLVRLVNATREDRIAEAVGGLLDLPGFIRYVAAQNFVAESDGILGKWGLNNFYLYRLEDQSQHVLIAWDADVTFWGPSFPTNEGHDDNVLMAKLMRVPEYRDLYAAELRHAADVAAEVVDDRPWLDAEIHRQLALVDDALRQDPVRPHTAGQFEMAAAAMRQFTNPRVAFVRCELDRGPRRGC